jgi:TM2 domain-containing membrane protein YozV
MKCLKCKTENQRDSNYCIHCGAPLSAIEATDKDDGIRPTKSRKHAQGKDPTLAVILSGIVPGLALGQFYNGDFIKGIVMLVGALVLGWTIVGLIAIWVWSIVDAYQVAKGSQDLWR